VEIQQERENWKFNKSGFITQTAKWESYEAALSGIQMSRNSGKQQCVLLALSPRHSTNLEWPLLYTHLLSYIACRCTSEGAATIQEQRQIESGV